MAFRLLGAHDVAQLEAHGVRHIPPTPAFGAQRENARMLRIADEGSLQLRWGWIGDALLLQLGLGQRKRDVHFPVAHLVGRGIELGAANREIGTFAQALDQHFGIGFGTGQRGVFVRELLARLGERELHSGEPAGDEDDERDKGRNPAFLKHGNLHFERYVDHAKARDLRA